MNQEKIGTFIAKCRKEKGLTQVELADQLGITNRAVSKWENGKSMPDVSIMMDLANLLDISVNELIIGEKIEMKDYKEKAEKNVVSLMMSLKQLKILEFIMQVLTGFGIALTVFAIMTLPTVTQKIVFGIIGVFMWGVGLFLQIKIRKTINTIEDL